MFYDLHVHTSLSIGENSLEETIEMAKNLGLSGIGVARYYTGSLDKLTVVDNNIINAVIIKPDNIEELEKIADKIRKKVEVLMVHGGDYDINRAACENSKIDVLCHPELGRKDSGLDHICVKAANENNVAIEINFREVLESYKRQRVYVLSSLRKNIKLCDKYNTRILTTSGSVTKWGMRSGRELASIPHILGMELGKSINSVSEVPEQIIRENREKLSGNKWEGVSIEGD